MASVRQDAWTEEDDLILAEVTLRHIREGNTQLAAFEEVGERIGRTAAACGFRWNSFVRKKYEAAIQMAKAQRQKRNQMKKQASVSAGAVTAGMLESGEQGLLRSDGMTEEAISIDAIIRFLRQWKTNHQNLVRQVKSLEKELADTKQQLETVKQENERLQNEVNEVQSDYRAVNEDYKALIKIMDRARKLAILSDDEQVEDMKARFKMDANGNLERIE